MLIDAITHEFDAYFQQDPTHDTILWFDPTGEWRELLPHLRARLPRLITREGQLHVRYLLTQRQPGERAVVYLPMEKERATYLRPYFYTAKCYQASLAQVLRQAGVTLPEARELRDLLPALAVASVGKGAAFWQGIVTIETALDRLFPNFTETVLRGLATPRQMLAALPPGQERSFFERVRLQFGIPGPVPDQEEAWADRFTAQLCLVEARAGLPYAPGFPFEDSLSPKPTWELCRALLRQWQHHELFKAAFKQRAKALDSQYRLDAWAATLPPDAPGSSFLNVEQALWQPVQARLEALQDKEEAVAFAEEYRTVFAHRAATFWAREGEVPGWQALQDMGEVLALARQALAEVEAQPTPAALIARYAAAWWQVDAAYRRFRTRLDRAGGGLDAALKWTGRIYQDYLETVNARFTTLLAQATQWPPAGYRLAGVALWEKRAGKPGKRALILVDALRYELARDLAARLDVADDALQVAVSPLPSVTELGMTALLPGWGQFRVDYDDDWVIHGPESSDNLAHKDKRLAWLTAHVGHAAVFDLDQWLATPLDAVDKDAGWIIVTSQTIDAIGEGAGTVALHTFDALLERLEHGVRRLLAAGCTDITLVTDHGFLLREAIRETDKVKAREPGLLKKSARYAVGRRATYPSAGDDWAALPHFPVHGSELVAWFPRGVDCFLTPGPYNYMHGGVALQEVVIPILTIRQTALERPVGVFLELPAGAELRNAIFKVRLIPTGGDLLSQPRQVEIDIVRQGRRVSRVWEAQVGHDIVEKPLMLETVYGLNLGDAVEIRARDAITGELLDSKTAIVKVDLDL